MYFIDESGIYDRSNERNDEVSYFYYVKFDGSINMSVEFDKFCQRLRAEGAERRSKEIGRLLGVVDK